MSSVVDVVDVVDRGGFSGKYSLYLPTRKSFGRTHHTHHNPPHGAAGKATGKTRPAALGLSATTKKQGLLLVQQGADRLSANKVNDLRTDPGLRGNVRGNNTCCLVVPDSLMKAGKLL
jgi:hypothetical protein